MKKIFFMLILFSFLCPKAKGIDVANLESECKKFITEPEVNLEYTYGRLRYHFDRDRSSIKRLMERKNIETGYEQINGLTLTGAAFYLDFDAGVIDINNQYACVYPDKIDAFVGYEAPNIYIASDLKKGTCEYDLTIRHENTHMEIYITALDHFLPEFKKVLDGLYDSIGVRIVKKADLKQEINDFGKMYNEVAKNTYEKWYNKVIEEQKKQDTMKHYILEDRICREIGGKYYK